MKLLIVKPHQSNKIIIRSAAAANKARSRKEEFFIKAYCRNKGCKIKKKGCKGGKACYPVVYHDE